MTNTKYKLWYQSSTVWGGLTNIIIGLILVIWKHNNVDFVGFGLYLIGNGIHVIAGRFRAKHQVVVSRKKLQEKESSSDVKFTLSDAIDLMLTVSNLVKQIKQIDKGANNVNSTKVSK